MCVWLYDPLILTPNIHPSTFFMFCIGVWHQAMHVLFLFFFFMKVKKIQQNMHVCEWQDGCVNQVVHLDIQKLQKKTCTMWLVFIMLIL